MGGDNRSGMASTAGIGVKSGVDFDAVFPAVLQCFTVIGGGYLARRFNLIGMNDMKGIKTLIVYFLMPAMIAQAVLAIHWDKVNWRFIACVFIAKAFVFVAVAAVTLALSNDMGKAGIYGIFATQSNDMALGCPLIKALYGASHPEYIDYIYLLIPVSLMILNPIGFLMMEIETHRKAAARLEQQPSTAASRGTSGRCRLLRRVLWGITKNPVIISTVVSLIVSVCLGPNKLPPLVDTVLDGFASGFISVALFALGCMLVSGGKPDARYPIGTALLLSLAKILLLPLVLRELISLTKIGRGESDTSNISIFGFLYGSLPTAPTVFVFACQYNLAVKQVSTALALVTFLSAPWVYLSSRMISINHIDKAEYLEVFSVTEMNSAVIGFVTAIVCMIVYVATSKIRRVPHIIVFYLLLCSAVASIGVVIGEAEWDQARFIWRRILVRTLILWGELSLRLLAVFLAIAMTILRSVGLCLVLRLRTTAAVIGFCFPLFVALSVVISSEVAYTGGTSQDAFDRISAYITTMVVSLCLIANVLLLICQYKCGTLSIGCVHHSNQTTANATAAPEPAMEQREAAAYDNEIPDIEDGVVDNGRTHRCSGCDEAVETESVDKLGLLEPGDIEGEEGPSTSQIVRAMCPSNAPCSSEHRHKCKRLLRQYMKKARPITARSVSLEPPDLVEDGEDTDVYEITKHSLLVAFLCISMTVSLFVSLWQSVRPEQEGGTYLQLRLLDIVLLYGQPVAILVLFGLDTSWLAGLRRRFRRLWYGSEKLALPALESIDRPTKAVCEQFNRHHLADCAKDIAKTKRSTLSVQENVFRGVDLVDWLVKNGVSDGRASSVKYGRRLILGRLIEHTDQEEHFHDSTSLYYRFVPPTVASSHPVASQSC